MHGMYMKKKMYFDNGKEWENVRLWFTASCCALTFWILQIFRSTVHGNVSHCLCLQFI